MTRRLLNKRAWVVVLMAGAMPLGTFGTCDYTPGYGGSFYYDKDGDHLFHGGHDGVVVIEDYGYDDVYYEDVYYEEVYYEDDFCDSPFFWDCWW